jgi:hypothetical protein
LINALSIFVVTPNHVIARTVPWRDTPLCLGDLLRQKLVGYSKSCPLSGTAVERYASVLDFDSLTFRGLLYSRGVMLKEFTNSKRRWDENTFLAHVQFCLMELGRTVLMAYHWGNQALISGPRQDFSVLKGGPADSKYCPRAIPPSDAIRSLNLVEEDVEIVEVLLAVDLSSNPRSLFANSCGNNKLMQRQKTPLCFRSFWTRDRLPARGADNERRANMSS